MKVGLYDGSADTETRVVERGGDKARLTTKEAALLGYLAARPGQSVSREELLTEVWGYAPTAQTRAIDHTMSRLRGKIEADPSQPKHLQTVHGEGYSFTPAPEVARGAKVRPARDRFVGRLAVCEALVARLAGEPGLVTLCGPGGVGKTRLALEVSDRLAAPLPTWFADLTEAKTRDDVWLAVARALGIERFEGLSEAQLAEGLAGRGAGLVILDNAEQVVQHVAGLVRALQSRAAEARMLVTSRERLRLAGEWTVDLPPLEPGPAVDLFVERAARIGVQVDASDQALGRLVERLDRLPLAIELAAGRSRALGPAQLLAHLERRFELLEARERDRPDRQRSLRASLDASWSLLEAGEQRLLAACSVFRGGFTLEAAAAVLGIDPLDAVDGLEALVDRSLVYRDGERFDTLLSVREYAAQHLAETSGARRRHAAYFAAEAQPHGAPVGESPSRLSLAWLRRERGNLLAALEGAGADDELAVSVALALRPLYAVEGPLERLVEVLSGAVARARGVAEREARVRIARADALRMSGRLEEAQVELGVAAELLEGSGDAELWARQRLVQARVDNLLGRAGEALRALEASLEAAREAGHGTMEALVLDELGTVSFDAGAIEAAQRCWREARQAYARLEERAAEARLLSRLATTFLEAGRLDDAREAFREAVLLHQDQGDRRREGVALANLGVVEHEAGRLREARRALERALELHRIVGHRRFEGFALGALGALAHEEGELDVAAELAERSRRIFEEARDGRFEAVAWARLGAARAAQGELETARGAFAKARERFEAEGLAWGLAGLGVLEELLPEGGSGRPDAPSRGSFARIARRMIRR